MARRRGRFTPLGTDGDPRLQDDSPHLWDAEHSEVARGLLTSAVRCFASKGYHATTTRDISAALGLSPAALYVHFPSKELVLFEIMRLGHQAALARIQGPEIELAGDAEQKLRTIVSRYTCWHAQHRIAARVCQNELAALTPQHYQQILEIRHRTNEVFREAVSYGIGDRSFADVDINRIVRAMLSLSIDLVRWYQIDGPDSPQQLGDFYADIALRIVTNPPKLAAEPDGLAYLEDA